MAQYSVFLDDAFGYRIADASNFLALDYSRVTNSVSTLKLTLPGDFNPQFIINPDGRIEVWRKLDSVWFTSEPLMLTDVFTLTVVDEGLRRMPPSRPVRLS